MRYVWLGDIAELGESRRFEKKWGFPGYCLRW